MNTPSDQEITTPPPDNWLAETARGLARVPAYLLVFALATAPTFTGADFRVTVATLVTAVVVVVFVETGNRRLERQKLQVESQRDSLSEAQRTALPVVSEAQARRFEDLQLPEREMAARQVLSGIIDNTQDLRFVYSSTRVEHYIAQDGRMVDYNFSDAELRVTAIPDARGIAYVHGILSLSGKVDRMQITTSTDFAASYWDDNLILIGSPNANAQTALALRAFGCPYEFNENVTAIREVAAGDRSWPENEAELDEKDFAIFANLKRRVGDAERSCLVLAGIGGTATLAACYYFQRNIISLCDRFGSAPFAGVLQLDRKMGHTSVSESLPFTELPAVSPR